MQDLHIKKMLRLSKYLARCGIGSRREIEKLLLEGRIRVDGEVCKEWSLASPETHLITVDGRPVSAPAQTRVWRFHKPPGVVVSRKRQQEKWPLLFDLLPPTLPYVVTVGRLDVYSEGLILLTNDGAWATQAEAPSTGLLRRYRVKVFGPLRAQDLQCLCAGISYRGVFYQAKTATLEHQKGMQSWISLTLTEGKNREVRNMMAALGLQVSRLIRTDYGPFSLGTLKRGELAPCVPT